MIAFDTSVLIDWFNPKLQGQRAERIGLLIETLERRKEQIIVPAPAYAEFLTKSGKARSSYQNAFHQKARLRVEPFSEKAAIECSILLEKAWDLRLKRKITTTKFKFDWMIVATAVAAGCSRIYASDEDIIRYAEHAGLDAMLTDNLPLPEQPQLDFAAPSSVTLQPHPQE
jgi:predicted nucleic acid-binding protein